MHLIDKLAHDPTYHRIERRVLGVVIAVVALIDVALVALAWAR
jgi:hypothetical protein